MKENEKQEALRKRNEERRARIDAARKAGKTRADYVEKRKAEIQAAKAKAEAEAAAKAKAEADAAAKAKAEVSE